MPEPLRFAHFEVLSRPDGSPFVLGKGAMGVTYKAFDRNLHSLCVIKVISPLYVSHPAARERFQQEAQSMAKIKHPNVAAVFHLGESPHGLFYAMEFCDGPSLQEYVEEKGQMDPAQSLSLIMQAAGALQAVADNDLIHRDIKPSNLLLVNDVQGRTYVKLIDFGLARDVVRDERNPNLSQGGFVGTPTFASPEQLLEQQDLDIRSDIYSLGITLWFMLCGRPPFTGSQFEVMFHHVNSPPPWDRLPPMPGRSIEVLKRMIEKNADSRFQSPGDLLRELQHALQADGTHVSAYAARLAIVPKNSGASVIGTSSVEILGEADSDATGKVFRARDVQSGETVTLKYLAPDLAKPVLLTKLQRLVRSLRKFEHPHLAKVIGYEKGDDGARLITEWVRGPSLLSLLKSRTEIRLSEAAPILGQIASGFDYAADRGLTTLESDLHQIAITNPAWGEDPAAWARSLRQPVSKWGEFSVKINPLRLSRAPQDYPTLADGPTRAPGTAGPEVTRNILFAFLQIVHRLLGGASGSGSHPTHGGGHYIAVPSLSAESNDYLEQFTVPPAPGVPPPAPPNCATVLREICRIEGIAVPVIFEVPLPEPEPVASSIATVDTAVNLPAPGTQARPATVPPVAFPPVAPRQGTVPGPAPLFSRPESPGTQALRPATRPGTVVPGTGSSAGGLRATGSSAGGLRAGAASAALNERQRELEKRRLMLEIEAERLKAQEAIEQERLLIEDQRRLFEEQRAEFTRMEAERAQRIREEQRKLEDERVRLEARDSEIKDRRREIDQAEQEIKVRTQLWFAEAQEQLRQQKEEWEARREELERDLHQREEKFRQDQQEHFRQLRQKREQLEQNQNSLEQKGLRTEQEEANLRQQLADLQAERQRLSEAQAELQRLELARAQDFERLRESFEKERAELERRVQERAAEQARQLAEREAELAAERQKLAAEHAAREAELRQAAAEKESGLAASLAALVAREADLQTARDAIIGQASEQTEQQEVEIERQRQRLAQERQQLEALQKSFAADQERDRLAVQTRLAAEEQRLAAVRAELDATRQSQEAELRAALAAERAALEQERQRLHAEAEAIPKATAQELEAQRAELDAQRAALSARANLVESEVQAKIQAQAELERERAEVAAQQAQLAAERDRLDAERQRLTEELEQEKERLRQEAASQRAAEEEAFRARMAQRAAEQSRLEAEVNSRLAEKKAQIEADEARLRSEKEAINAEQRLAVRTEQLTDEDAEEWRQKLDEREQLIQKEQANLDRRLVDLARAQRRRVVTIAAGIVLLLTAGGVGAYIGWPAIQRMLDPSQAKWTAYEQQLAPLHQSANWPAVLKFTVETEKDFSQTLQDHYQSKGYASQVHQEAATAVSALLKQIQTEGTAKLTPETGRELIETLQNLSGWDLPADYELLVAKIKMPVLTASGDGAGALAVCQAALEKDPNAIVPLEKDLSATTDSLLRRFEAEHNLDNRTEVAKHLDAMAKNAAVTGRVPQLLLLRGMIAAQNSKEGSDYSAGLRTLFVLGQEHPEWRDRLQPDVLDLVKAWSALPPENRTAQMTVVKDASTIWKRPEIFRALSESATLDDQRASYLTAAAEAGDTRAKAQVADMYFRRGMLLRNNPNAAGDGEKSPAGYFRDAVKLAEAAAQTGDDLAESVLALSYLWGAGQTSDLDKAIDYGRKAAEKDLPLGLQVLGESLSQKGEQRNDQGMIEEATDVLEKAVKLDAPAAFSLADAYIKLMRYKDAVRALEIGATREKNAVCQYLLGSLIDEGKGAQKNEVAARDWVVKAAGQGLVQAKEWCRRRAERYKTSTVSGDLEWVKETRQIWEK